MDLGREPTASKSRILSHKSCEHKTLSCCIWENTTVRSVTWLPLLVDIEIPSFLPWFKKYLLNILFVQDPCSMRQTVCKTLTFELNGEFGEFPRWTAGLVIDSKDLCNSMNVGIITVLLHYNRRLQISISQGKVVPRAEPAQVLSPGNMGGIPLLEKACDKMHGVLPAREAHQSLGVPSFS